MKKASVVYLDQCEPTPVSFWAHRHVGEDVWMNAKQFDPPLPAPVPGRGWAQLVIEFDGVELRFSSAAELDRAGSVIPSVLLSMMGPGYEDMARKRTLDDGHGFVRGLRLERDRVPSFDSYPFSIPAVRELSELRIDRKMTFFVGENGSGKSTLLEALAELAGFNREGGTKNFNFATHSENCELAQCMRVVRGARRERGGFFLRAESFFNAATYIDNERLDSGAYGGTSFHKMSHGESFLALVQHKFNAQGLYLLDEPEAALSPSRQLSVLRLIHGLIEEGNAQFVIATHSPILLAYPNALIYHFGPGGIEELAYEDTEHYSITRDFLAAPARFLKHLFDDSAS